MKNQMVIHEEEKLLTQRELTIGNFMYVVYLPSLEKYIYYVHYTQILSKNHGGTI